MINNENRQFTRRQVLVGAIGTAGLAAIGGISAIGAQDEKKLTKIGCGTVCFRKLTLEEALERIHRAGYEYLETQATGPWCPHVDALKDDPQKFRQTVQKFGFKGVTGLWSSHGAIIPDAKSVEGITQTMRWAKEAGIPVVHAGDGRKPAKMSEEDALKILRDRIAEIMEVAEKCQVYLGIEPHGTFSLTADGLNKIMALSQSKWIGINYDTANVHRATYVETINGGYSWTPFGQRQDEVATLKAIANRVVHVHVKDVVGAKCVVLGEGKVNIRSCLQVLKERGYSGVLSLETEGEFSADEGQKLIEASRRYLVKTLAEI
ncbi:MAG: sugar phosphate isomerase/epimerase [Kiritimatiellae bacterium]|nr:sugar phosphate isomerase/epimerase [Kiritimatiellia bacterium]MDD5523278.1 sugar phosphate isomerase/epimerase [Kiritimatiellia bacterium]